VRRTAWGIATAGFFVMAIVGMAYGVPPLVCATRALGGAAVLFVLASLAGRLAVSLVVQAFLEHVARRPKGKDDSRERGN